MIYRFYFHEDWVHPYFGLFSIDVSRAPYMMVVTRSERDMAKEMDKRFIPYEQIDWKHEVPYRDYILPELDYDEAKAMAEQWIGANPDVVVVKGDYEDYEDGEDYSDILEAQEIMAEVEMRRMLIQQREWEEEVEKAKGRPGPPIT